jgi:hypothetical protein
MDAPGMGAPAHKCSAVSVAELRDTVHRYAKDNGIDALKTKQNVGKKTRSELVELIHGWPDFPTRACCAARDVPRGRAAVLRRQSLAAAAAEMAEGHDRDMLDETVALHALVDDVADDDDVGVRKFTVPATVKMKLATFVKDKDVLAEIKTLPPKVNRLEGEAYAFGNFYLIRLINNAEAELPVIDRNFYYRCIIAVATNNAHKSTLTQSWLDAIAAFDLHRPRNGRPKVDIIGSVFNQIVCTLSKKMATMATNHLTTNLANRLRTYLSWRYPRLKKLRQLIVDAVLLTPQKSLEEIFAPTPGAGMARNARLATAKDVAHNFRVILPLKGSKQFASSAHHTLRFYHHILTETERAMHDQEVGRPSTSKDWDVKKPRRIRFKPFTMLPTKAGYTISYVSVSSAAFINILKKLKKVDSTVPAGGGGLDHDAQRNIWARFCNVKAVATHSRRFDCSIATDGCAISVLVAKRSSIICPDAGDDAMEEARRHPNAAKVAVDPGFTSTVVVAKMTFDANGKECDPKTVSYSSSKYYERSKVHLSRRRTARWNEEKAVQAASVPSPRTADMDKMAAHLKAYIRELPGLIDHRMARGYRNMRFMRFKFKQKAIHEICNLIAPNSAKTLGKGAPTDHTIVFFGNWNGGNGTPISRRASGPLQEIKLELMSRARVTLVMVDEFKTSVTCHRCYEPLVNMKAHTTRVRRWQGVKTETEMHGQRVHSILHCKSSDCHKKGIQSTMNRDVNASKNILNIGIRAMKGELRPAAMCRPVAPLARPRRRV